jgi:hypothetical protein
MRKGWIIVGVALVAVGVGWTSGFFQGFTRAFWESRQAVLEGHQGLPSCETETGLANAKAAINAAPLLKQFGITALGISDVKTSSTAETRVECQGQVILSSGKKGPIEYSFTKDPSVDAPFLVKAKIEPEKLVGF